LASKEFNNDQFTMKVNNVPTRFDKPSGLSTSLITCRTTALVAIAAEASGAMCANALSC
jgi:hypothetical protein